MLRFDIHSDDLMKPWAWRNSLWLSGTSWINPLQLDALRTESSRGSRGTVIAVRENRLGGDFVELTLGNDRSVCLRAGSNGTAPLYVASNGTRLVGSWDPAELAPFARADALSPVVVARLLTRRHRYSAQTLFTTITRLTAGATITWSLAAGMSVRYPPPAAHVGQPRRLRPGADPIAHFGALADRAVAEVCDQHRRAVAVELSGGLDSANIALSAAGLAPSSLLSGGLIVGGHTGHAQSTRRRAISEHLGLRDTAILVAEHLPLCPDGPRVPESAHYPDGDVYQEASDALRAVLHDAGARVVLTGYGGDEIMSLAPAERSSDTRPPRLPPWLDRRTEYALADIDTGCSPVTEVALPTLVVFAARHPSYLRAGLWPIAPFASPELSRFGRSLPVEWRTGKELLRQRLTRFGLPRSVTHPVRPESFAATMRTALRRYAPALLADMLERSVLIEHGLVRQNAIENLHRMARDGQALSPLVYDMLALDIGIRSMCDSTSTGKRNRCVSSMPNR